MSSNYYPTETYGMNIINEFPRFGHGSDFSKLASSQQEEQTDYVVGHQRTYSGIPKQILSVSFFILSLFIVWGAIVLACKCMGSKRVGLFAGRILVQSDTKGQYPPPTYLWKLRCTFILFGCCMLLLCLALVGPGLSSIDYTVESTRNLNRDVKDFTTQALLIVDSVKRVKWNVDELDVDSILRLDESCPNFKNNTFTDNMERLNKEFIQLRQFMKKSDIDQVKYPLDVIMNATDSVDQVVITVEENDWIIKLFALFISGLTIFMIIATCITLSGRFQFLRALNCMTELIILPLFMLSIIGSWVTLSVLAFGSIPIADFCSGNDQGTGAAGTVIDIFNERGLTSNSLIFVAFKYYQTGCTTQDPMQLLYQHEDTLQRGIYSASAFVNRIDTIGVQKFIDQCGADVSSHIEGIGIMKDSLGVLLDALRSSFELASCYNMSPLYRKALDGTICSVTMRSFTLMFLIMLSISLVGMVMIIVRSAMYPFKVVLPVPSMDEYYDDELEEYQAYLEYMASFINMWGVNTDDELSDRSKTSALKHSHETSITHDIGDSSTVSSNGTTRAAEDHPRQHKRNNHKTPQKRKDLDAKFNDEESLDKYPEDEETKPLSPRDHMPHSTRIVEIVCENIEMDDECTPLTPPSGIFVQSSYEMRNRRNPTPKSFFQRWRRDEENRLGDYDNYDRPKVDVLPETPLMISPTAPPTRDYFSRIFSPVRKVDTEGGKFV